MLIKSDSKIGMGGIIECIMNFYDPYDTTTDVSCHDKNVQLRNCWHSFEYTAVAANTTLWIKFLSKNLISVFVVGRACFFTFNQYKATRLCTITGC